MDHRYVVEWFGELYGPFASHQAAQQFRPPVRSDNPMARGVVRVLQPPTIYTMAELQERACFPNGR